MQMTLYSHHNIILMNGTYSEIFVKIRHDDVILRHVTSFCYIPRKCCWQTADVCKKYPVWVNQYRFFAKNITRAFIWGVNHLSTIIGSLFIAVAVEVPICHDFPDFWWQKCWHQQKIDTFGLFLGKNDEFSWRMIFLPSFKLST